MMNLKSLRASSLCIVLAASLVAPQSHAQSAIPQDTAQARVRFQRGVELYESGDVQAAYIEFKRAYELAPNYQLLFNIAQAQAELKDYVGALGALNQYLEQGQDEISVERRQSVTEEIRRLRSYIAKVVIHLPVPDVEIRVDGVQVTTPAQGEALSVSAGRRNIVITKKGYEPWETYVNLAGQDRIELKVRMEPIQTAAPAEPAPVGVKRELVYVEKANNVERVPLGPLFWTGLTASLAFGGATTVLGVLTLRAQAKHREALDRIPTTQGRLDRSAYDLKRLALATDIGFVLTGGAAVLTIAALAARGRTKRRKTQERLQAAIHPTGLVLHGRF